MLQVEAPPHNLVTPTGVQDGVFVRDLYIIIWLRFVPLALALMVIVWFAADEPLLAGAVMEALVGAGQVKSTVPAAPLLQLSALLQAETIQL